MPLKRGVFFVQEKIYCIIRLGCYNFGMKKTNLTLTTLVLLFVFVSLASAHDTDGDWFHPTSSTYSPSVDSECPDDLVVKIAIRYDTLYERHVVNGPKNQHWHFKFTAEIKKRGRGSDEYIYSCGSWETGSWHQGAVDFDNENSDDVDGYPENSYSEDLPDLEMEDGEWVNQDPPIEEGNETDTDQGNDTESETDIETDTDPLPEPDTEIVLPPKPRPEPKPEPKPILPPKPKPEPKPEPQPIPIVPPKQKPEPTQTPSPKTEPSPNNDGDASSSDNSDTSSSGTYLTQDIFDGVFIPSEDDTPDIVDSTINDIFDDIVIQTPDDMPEDIVVTVDEVIEGVVEEPIELAYQWWQWYKGYNLVSVPVLPEHIETIADLYNEYALFNAPQDSIIIYDYDTMNWMAYSGEDNVVGNTVITPYLGMVMMHDQPAALGMYGVKLVGDGFVNLRAGLNIVGLTELPDRLQKPSDIASDPNICGVITRTTDDAFERPKWHLIVREGDSGDDIPLAIGQAVIIFCYDDMVLDLSNSVAAAPSASRELTTSWGAIKQQ